MLSTQMKTIIRDHTYERKMLARSETESRGAATTRNPYEGYDAVCIPSAVLLTAPEIAAPAARFAAGAVLTSPASSSRGRFLAPAAAGALPRAAFRPRSGVPDMPTSGGSDASVDVVGH